MAADLPPLPVLLSQVLVAFTIEFDNEAERRMTHRTSLGRAAGAPGRGPWRTTRWCCTAAAGRTGAS